MKKVAIFTEALGPLHSGGIRCIVYFLNILKKRGYEVCAFTQVPPYNSTWLPSDFEVLPYDSEAYRNYDGILISPYSPTAALVDKHPNAKQKIYWVHTFEGAFKHNNPDWIKNAIQSYKLKNIKYMATSHYVKTFLELIFERRVLPNLVPGGVDHSIFKFDEEMYAEKMKSDKVIFGVLNRPEPLRGLSIAYSAFDLLKREFGDKVELYSFAGIPQDQMYKAYGHTHYFIDPSLLAGLPLPPLEAMSCGSVPITTHYGTNDYIRDGENGFFINTGDVSHTLEVLRKCTKLLEHIVDYDSLVDRTREEARNWTWEHMVDNFETNLEYI